MTHDGRKPLPDNELTWRFSRSSGPGGQHVNTSDTRVELIWSLARTSALSPAQKARAADRLSSRLVDGSITIVSSQYRSQHRNREAARVRLEELVTDAIKPARTRHKTRPSKASQRRQQEAKKAKSTLKQSRRGIWE